jgi:hypothetical protein
VCLWDKRVGQRFAIPGRMSRRDRPRYTKILDRRTSAKFGER